MITNPNLNSGTASLLIRDYQVHVSLGCSREEQSLIQPVLITCEICLLAPEGHVPPVGEIGLTPFSFETTDHLSDAIDYVQICNTIQAVAGSKSFHLVEHLGYLVLESIVEFLKKSHPELRGQVSITAVKLRPPVPYLLGGVSWTCHGQF